jgi:uncharacterized membrane protein
MQGSTDSEGARSNVEPAITSIVRPALVQLRTWGMQGDSHKPIVAEADPTEFNVEAIAKLERESLLQRSAAEQISDVITRFTGSITFVVLHVLLFAVWVLVNLNLIPGIAPFDPFPFGILTLIVSTEGVFLAIFILISQNRMSRQAERRAHLDLQISILSEQEMTMMLRMQQKLCQRLDVEVEPIKEEAQRLMDKTDVRRVVDKLDERLPGS